MDHNTEARVLDSSEPPQDPSQGDKFQPMDLKSAPPIESSLPPELWTIVQAAPANFTPTYFLEVSRNLLENPNLTASHLSRAELSYSSFTDPSYNPSAQHPHELAKIIKHLKPDHQPKLVTDAVPVPEYQLEWTVVRKLIPRNPKLDSPLLQTCHLYTSSNPTPTPTSDNQECNTKTERYLVIYIPHVTTPNEIPFYHPTVRKLAILYTYRPSLSPPGLLLIHYDLFPSKPLDNRLTRTALKMLEIIHKHSRGRQAGYQKRVHHDLIIPQKPFQDTYTYLKGKYCKQLIDNWVEQTPAEKHVFEDLGIAAFLIELWIEMYGEKTDGPQRKSESLTLDALSLDDENNEQRQEQRRVDAQSKFPGFVDIGCGNGLLVNILNQEGWTGWGFDARKRKTWSTFSTSIQSNLKEMLLVPEVLTSQPNPDSSDSSIPSHNGVFPQGTFIISNHADELTLWTPLLAYVSDSPFIAIPCCSHNFGGTRFRAPFWKEFAVGNVTVAKGKQPSAYASLCSYLARLTAACGFKVETEFLRIPSTRNVGVVGRVRMNGHEAEERSMDERLEFARGLVENEMQECSIEQVRLQWLRSGSGLVKEKTGH
ncbi:DUF1613-domain-containing protein [Sporormia fimetaria CBS 119925]|uniref:tRNA (uracil-O(2)-)-methyltransferase n=1 Tax=Sporormia fimetaria CBS 119925 TaxID=1340428 RepID=A0A6A6V7Z5_9PLEO|nr:DUF1613-domain-containing protein [Sporormia fimetaria CBS 119925]